MDLDKKSESEFFLNFEKKLDDFLGNPAVQRMLIVAAIFVGARAMQTWEVYLSTQGSLPEYADAAEAPQMFDEKVSPTAEERVVAATQALSAMTEPDEASLVGVDTTPTIEPPLTLEQLIDQKINAVKKPGIVASEGVKTAIAWEQKGDTQYECLEFVEQLSHIDKTIPPPPGGGNAKGLFSMLAVERGRNEDSTFFAGEGDVFGGINIITPLDHDGNWNTNLWLKPWTVWVINERFGDPDDPGHSFMTVVNPDDPTTIVVMDSNGDAESNLVSVKILDQARFKEFLEDNSVTPENTMAFQRQK